MNSGAQRRLDAPTIVQMVGRETVSSFEYRALLGFIPAVTIFVLALVTLELNVLLALLLSILVWIIVGSLPNEEKLLWISSESQNNSTQSSLAITRPLNQIGRLNIRSAGAIRAGQYVVSFDDFQELLRDNISREDERKRIAREQSAKIAPGSNQSNPIGSESELIRAEIAEGATQVPADIVTSTPMVKFLPVVVVWRMAEKLVTLGMAGNGTIEDPFRDEDKFYLLRKEDIPQVSPTAPPGLFESAAAALTDLMESLTKESREDHLVATLLSKKHSDGVIRHALRSALAFGLIKRQPNFRHAFISRIPEVTETFKRSMASYRGHERCLISRTELGEMWVNPPAEDELTASTIIVLGNLEYNTSRDDEMVEILRKTLSLLEQLGDCLSEASDPAAVMAAVDIIRSAKSRPTSQRGNVKKAAKILLNICGQLIIGAGGNELFTILTQLAK